MDNLVKKITLRQWAIQKGVHYNTAQNWYKQGKIPNTERNNLGYIYVTLVEEKDEMLFEDYLKNFGIEKLINKYGFEEFSRLFHIDKYMHDSTTEKILKTGPDYKTNTQIKIQSTKPAKVIVPSTLEGDALILENTRRCKELGINYGRASVFLARNCYGMPENLSQYLDAYETNKKTTLTGYVSALEQESEIMFKGFFDKEEEEPEPAKPVNIHTTKALDPTHLSDEEILAKIYSLADKKEVDYDLVRYHFEKSKYPFLQSPASHLEYLSQNKLTQDEFIRKKVQEYLDEKNNR